MAGTLSFVPGHQLPRHDKGVLERSIASTFLIHLSHRDGSTFADVESNPKDPPDVTFTYNGEPRGMELCEILPENRLEKDSIIHKLRRAIISRLMLGEATSGFVFTIFFVNDYAARIRPGPIEAALANALNNFFDHGDPQAKTIEVPEQIKNIVARIGVFREHLKGDPRLEDDREPLLVFGAQSTMLIPEDDCRTMVESRLSRKGLHDQAIPTWLLLWSSHHALVLVRANLDDAIGFYLQSHPLNYERVFHLHESGATEFPNPTTRC